MNDIDVLKATFPILRIKNLGETSEYCFCGTGFFIKSDGTFLSASHVFDKRSDNIKYLFLDNRVNGWKTPPIEIATIKEDCSKDILLGKIDFKPSAILPLSNKLVAVNENVRQIGYPEFEFSMNGGVLDLSKMLENLINTKVIHNDCHYTDEIHYPCDVSVFVSLTQHASIKGMSGGPVVNELGVVHGILTGNSLVNGNSVAAVIRHDEIQTFLN